MALAFGAGDAWTPRDADSWWPLLWRTIALFFLWCMVSSAMYLVNDVRDREADRVHPRKRTRPIASGAVSAGTALATAAIFATIALPLAFALDSGAGAVLAVYGGVMLAYSAGLKRVVIVDILILCTGVVARAISGALTIDVIISPWLYVCSSFVALFFATSKRWSEFHQLGAQASAHRPSLAHYTAELLNQLLSISAAGALLGYSIYTIESDHVPRNGAMAITIPFVVFGMFRYLLLLSGPRKSEAPDQILFTDHQIIAAGVGFVCTAIVVLLVSQ